MRVLVMGLSGAGKSSLVERICNEIDAIWLNADKLREHFDDWDFSYNGRMRQAKRMRALSDLAPDKCVIADFIAPHAEQRDLFAPDIVIWMNTVKSCQYENTNLVFTVPSKYDLRIDDFDQIDILKIVSILKEN